MDKNVCYEVLYHRTRGQWQRLVCDSEAAGWAWYDLYKKLRDLKFIALMECRDDNTSPCGSSFHCLARVSNDILWSVEYGATMDSRGTSIPQEFDVIIRRNYYYCRKLRKICTEAEKNHFLATPSACRGRDVSPDDFVFLGMFSDKAEARRNCAG